VEGHVTPVTDDRYDTEHDLPAADAAWRERARTFAADVLAPQVRDADRAGAFPADLIPRLGAAGLIGASVPATEGGGGASCLAMCAIAEEIGAVDGSVRGFLAVQGGLVLVPILTDAPAHLKTAWAPGLIDGTRIGAFALTEPEAGSDLGGMRTTIREDGDEVVIDGRKIWITNGGVADVVLVFGTVDPTARTKGLECYLVPADTPGLTAKPMPGRELGHRASNHADLTLEGVRVPKANRLGAARGGYAVAMHGLDDGRLHVAAGAVGIHRAALEACVAFARTRRQFGQRIGDFQQVGATLAEMDVELRAARLLTHHAARLKDRGVPDPVGASAAKLYATEAALRAATQAVQLHGARAYTDDLPIERLYRDAIALTIYEGTSNIQRVILSRHLLGRDEGASA
jgi:alkylation response protein AidB-like acyl-CoA dehydrogenase